MHAVPSCRAGHAPGESCSADPAKLAPLLLYVKALKESRIRPRMTTCEKAHLQCWGGSPDNGTWEGNARPPREMSAQARQRSLLCNPGKGSTVWAHTARRGTRTAPSLCLCTLQAAGSPPPQQSSPELSQEYPGHQKWCMAASSATPLE